MHRFLISLPDTPLRRKSAIDKLQTHGLSFELVDGIQAQLWRPESLPVNRDWNHSPLVGEVGCYLAHLHALQRIVDYQLPWACILEDDFCLLADPDVGLCEIESTLPHDFHYIHLQREDGRNPRFRITESCGIYERIHETPYGSTGYIITRPLAEYILRHHRCVDMPIDCLYAKLASRGTFYATAKPLIGIEPGLGSTIQVAQAGYATSS